MRTFVVGTRNSKLALIQTNWVINQLKNAGVQHPIKIEEFVTKGDRILNVSLSNVGGTGIFIKELEQAIIEKKIDFAVHSMKDLPATIPDDLVITAVPTREDHRDALISRKGLTLAELPKDAVIGTSSLRRSAQILSMRPDVNTEWIRGSVESRIEQLRVGKFDAIILAVAGLKRLNISDELITEYLPEETFIPAVGQGALAIQCRKDDEELRQSLQAINNENDMMAVMTERAFQNEFENGDLAPIGAIATVTKNGITLHTNIVSLDGKQVLTKTVMGNDPETVAKEAAQSLMQQGALQIMNQLKQRHDE